MLARQVDGAPDERPTDAPGWRKPARLTKQVIGPDARVVLVLVAPLPGGLPQERRKSRRGASEHQPTGAPSR